MSKLNAHGRSILFPISFSNFHLSKSPPPRHKSLFSALASNAASKTLSLASKTSKKAHWSSNGKRKLEKIALCGIVGHWPFRGRCSSHRLILTYTNIGASGTADHATLLQLFFLPLLVPLPRPNEILLGLPTSGAARCPRI